MTLTANTPLTIIRGEQSESLVASAVKIYEGAILGLNTSGYARGLVAGDKFYGHSMEYVDNLLGSDGSRTVQRLRGRYRLEVTLTGVAVTDIGREVFASADDTLTFSSGDNTRVGVVERYVTTNTAIVEFQTCEEPQEGIESVDVIGGAGDITALDLVYVSDQTAGIMTVLKAQSTAAGRFADYICPNAIAAAAKGLALKHFLLQGIDTDAYTVGDPVYLSDGVAGGYTLIKPTATDKIQIVGRVVEKHATTGAILFDLSGPQQVVHTHADNSEGGQLAGLAAIATGSIGGTDEIADVETAEAAGSSTKIARADHVHAIGAHDHSADDGNGGNIGAAAIKDYEAAQGGIPFIIHALCTAEGAEDEDVIASFPQKALVIDAWMIARDTQAANVTLKNAGNAFTGAVAKGSADDTIVSFATIIAEQDEIAAEAAVVATFSGAGSVDVFLLCVPIA